MTRTLDPRRDGSGRETTSTISNQHARLGAYPANRAYPASRRAYLAVVCTIGQAHGHKASGQETRNPCNSAIPRHRRHARNPSHSPNHRPAAHTTARYSENHRRKPPQAPTQPRPALDGAGIPRQPTLYATNTLTSWPPLSPASRPAPWQGEPRTPSKNFRRRTLLKEDIKETRQIHN